MKVLGNNFKTLAFGTILVATVALLTPAVEATSVKAMNVGDLINNSKNIVIGQVVNVTDGFDANNLPYTDVTVAIAQQLKGNAKGTYTFRQFGLDKPREVGGRTYIGVSPDGFPRFKQGEDVVLFLYAKTSLGFESATGLMQGKFVISGETITNPVDNAGLFHNVNIDPSLLSADEAKMLQSKKGPAPTSLFTDFVRKAVDNDWFTEN